MTKIINVLFYSDVGLELGNPVAKFVAINQLFVPMIKLLNEKNFSCTILTNQMTADLLKQKISANNLEICSPNIELLKECIDVNNIGVIFGQNRNYIKNSKFETLIRSLVVKEPDVIFVFESGCSFFSKMYPEAKIFYITPGIFSRSPFPHMLTISCNGFFYDSFVSNFKIFNKKANNFLNCAIDVYDRILKQYKFFDLYKDFNSSILDFEKKILVPLQVTGYWAYNSCCSYKNQVEFLENVLEKTNKNTAVIVTQYITPNIKNIEISPTVFANLKEKYDNLFYPTFSELVPSCSQFLLPLVDAVATVSSGVGLLAAILNKAVVPCGKSHINYISANEDIDNIQWNLNDNIYLSNYLYRTNIIRDETIHNKDWLINLIYSTLSKSQQEVENLLYYQFNTNTEDIFYASMNFEHFEKDIRKRNIRPYNAFSFDSFETKNINKEIDKNSTISFDLWDTLLKRKFLNSQDVFLYMDNIIYDLFSLKNFHEKRLVSEKYCEEKYGKGLYFLKDIYHAFSVLFNVNKQLCSLIMKKELDVELSIVKPNYPIIESYNYAINKKKNVIIISDTYYDSNFIISLLNKIGIKSPSKLLLSCEQGVCKDNNTIFSLYKNFYHIGDNKKSDYFVPKANGCDAYLLYDSKQKFLENKYFADISSCLSKNYKLSYLYSYILENNFYYRERLSSVSNLISYNFGYAMLGPILKIYVDWILKNIKIDKVENVIFLTREGLFFKDIFDSICKINNVNVKSTFIPSSRKLLDFVTIVDFSDFINFIKNHRKLNKLKTVLVNIIDENLLDVRLSEEILNKDINKMSIIDIYNVYIYLKDILHSRAYSFLSLIKNSVQNNSKIAFIDLGYNGSIIRRISSLCLFDNISLFAYFVMSSINTGINIPNVTVRSCYRNQQVNVNSDAFNSANIKILEFLLSGGCEACSSFIDGKVYYSEEDFRTRTVTSEIKRGVKSFVIDTSLNGNIIDCSDVNIDIPLLFLRNWSKDPNLYDALLFAGCKYDNNYDLDNYKYFLCDVDDVLIDKTLQRKVLWQAGLIKIMQFAQEKNKGSKINTSNKLIFLKKSAVNQYDNKTGNLKRLFLFVENLLVKSLTQRKYYIKYKQDRLLFFADSKSSFFNGWFFLIGRFLWKK